MIFSNKSEVPASIMVYDEGNTRTLLGLFNQVEEIAREEKQSIDALVERIESNMRIVKSNIEVLGFWNNRKSKKDLELYQERLSLAKYHASAVKHSLESIRAEQQAVATRPSQVTINWDKKLWILHVANNGHMRFDFSEHRCFGGAEPWLLGNYK